jgi:hypothetical protein
MTLLRIFWAGCLHLLPMDLTALRAAELQVLFVNGFGLDLLDSEVVDGTAGALWTFPFNLIAFFLSHHCLLVLLGIIGFNTVTLVAVHYYKVCPRNNCSSHS